MICQKLEGRTVSSFSEARIYGTTQNKKRARIKIQPRFKIQYPMKNRCKSKSNNWFIIYPIVGIFHLFLRFRQQQHFRRLHNELSPVQIAFPGNGLQRC